MFFWRISNPFQTGFGLWWRYQFIVGLLLVLAGVIIVLYPPILAFIVAAVIMLIGFSIMASAWQMRRVRRRPSDFDVEIHP